MAFVCEKPDVLNKALDQLIQFFNYETDPAQGARATDPNIQVAIEAVKSANILGILTIEDVIEVLLTENVYDESDLKRNINFPVEKTTLMEYKRQQKAEITHYFPPSLVKNKFEV
jgi:hypothetical protein